MISVEHLSVEFSARPLFTDVSFVINPKDRIALVGKNGAGKSTLLKILSSQQMPTSGTVAVQRDVTIGYLPQVMVLSDERTVMQEAEQAFEHISDMQEHLQRLGQQLADRTDYDSPDYMALVERFTHDTERFQLMGGMNYHAELERTLQGLGFTAQDFDRPTSEFSGGWRMRIELAKMLLQKPDVLLLDEPTNHLDAESIDWLEQHLNRYEGTVIAVTHDRYFLDDVAGWILELDRGEGIPWKGNYSSWLEQKTKRLEQEEKAAGKRRKTLERELEWVRMAPKARQAKGKARLNSYERLLSEDQKEKEQHLEIFIPNGPRLGNKVIEAHHVAKAFDDKVLYEDLDFTLPPAAIIGVIGPNGVGKTTLFRLIMGLETPDSGTFETGETVRLAYVDQQHKDIDPEKSVYEVISGGSELMRLGGRDVNARAYLSRFNFSGADQEKKCGVLSGGERNRLQLALALKQEGNVLLLDEPTNDIDINTLRALEEGLEAFAGCAVIISHDRWFLDRICTHILSFEGDGKVFFFEGSYTDYEANKAKRLGIEEPKRQRYRKLDE